MLSTHCFAHLAASSFEIVFDWKLSLSILLRLISLAHQTIKLPFSLKPKSNDLLALGSQLDLVFFFLPCAGRKHNVSLPDRGFWVKLGLNLVAINQLTYKLNHCYDCIRDKFFKSQEHASRILQVCAQTFPVKEPPMKLHTLVKVGIMVYVVWYKKRDDLYCYKRNYTSTST